MMINVKNNQGGKGIRDGDKGKVGSSKRVSSGKGSLMSYHFCTGLKDPSNDK